MHLIILLNLNKADSFAVFNSKKAAVLSTVARTSVKDIFGLESVRRQFPIFPQPPDSLVHSYYTLWLTVCVR